MLARAAAAATREEHHHDHTFYSKVNKMSHFVVHLYTQKDQNDMVKLVIMEFKSFKKIVSVLVHNTTLRSDQVNLGIWNKKEDATCVFWQTECSKMKVCLIHLD